MMIQFLRVRFPLLRAFSVRRRVERNCPSVHRANIIKAPLNNGDVGVESVKLMCGSRAGNPAVAMKFEESNESTH